MRNVVEITLGGKQLLKTVAEKFYRHTFPVLILILSFTLLAGCGTGKVKPASATYSVSPENILEKIALANNRRDTMQAVAHIEISSEKGRYPLKVALMVKKPSFLRVETIPLIGTPDFFLSLRGETLKIFLPLKREFYIGRATAENLALFLPVSIRIEDLVPVLMGIPPLLTGPAKGADKSPATLEENLYHIDMPSGDGKRQSLWIDRTTGDLVKVEIFEDSRLLYTALYEEYGEEGGIPMPRKVIITPDEPGKPGVVIRYSDIRFSNMTDTTPFDLSVPPGMEPITLY